MGKKLNLLKTLAVVASAGVLITACNRGEKGESSEKEKATTEQGTGSVSDSAKGMGGTGPGDTSSQGMGGSGTSDTSVLDMSDLPC
jgi:hypothetical protein